jgi:hypothetical protein
MDIPIERGHDFDSRGDEEALGLAIIGAKFARSTLSETTQINARRKRSFPPASW